MTNIEWVKNQDGTQGISVNSKTGCLNHDEGLCKGGGFPCYAYNLAHERLKQIYLTNPNTIVSHIINDTPLNMMQKQVKAELDPFYPRFWTDRLAGIRQIQKPTGIFLDDMSDWMGEYWPREWTEMELQLMRDCPQHRFYTLTKQPQQLSQWSPFPDNVWIGVTATNQESYYDGVSNIAKVEAKIKFVSFEPLLEQINGGECAEEYRLDSIDEFDWLIIGACTGTVKEMSRLVDKYPHLTPMQWGNKWTAQPQIKWLREIVEAADKAGVPVFLKDNLKPLLWHETERVLVPDWARMTGENDGLGGFVLRQEMPK